MILFCMPFASDCDYRYEAINTSRPMRDDVTEPSASRRTRHDGALRIGG